MSDRSLSAFSPTLYRPFVAIFVLNKIPGPEHLLLKAFSCEEFCPRSIRRLGGCPWEVAGDDVQTNLSSASGIDTGKAWKETTQACRQKDTPIDRQTNKTGGSRFPSKSDKVGERFLPPSSAPLTTLGWPPAYPFSVLKLTKTMNVLWFKIKIFRYSNKKARRWEM